ncbi:MAG: hypothetical protein L0215_06445 [Gemmataceae bacterium]|nr:hypothetical protein [Gemmataceae bacterium]
MMQLHTLLGFHKSGNMRDEDFLIGVMELVAEHGPDEVLGRLPTDELALLRQWVARFESECPYVVSGLWSQDEVRKQADRIKKAFPAVLEWLSLLN